MADPPPPSVVSAAEWASDQRARLDAAFPSLSPAPAAASAQSASLVDGAAGLGRGRSFPGPPLSIAASARSALSGASFDALAQRAFTESSRHARAVAKAQRAALEDREEMLLRESEEQALLQLDELAQLEEERMRHAAPMSDSGLKPDVLVGSLVDSHESALVADFGTLSRRLRSLEQEKSALEALMQDLHLSAQSDSASVRPSGPRVSFDPRILSSDLRGSTDPRFLPSGPRVSYEPRLTSAALGRIPSGPADDGPLRLGSALGPRPDLPVPVASFNSKIKAVVPRAWKGSYVRSDLVSFQKSVKGYFVTAGVLPHHRIDAEEAYSVKSALRSLFSPDRPSSGGISPLQWFDAQDDQGRFLTLSDAFTLMAAQWEDVNAADRALVEWRALKQGSFLAREFGQQVEVLALDCHTSSRSLRDSDLVEVFMNGLKRQFRQHVITQERMHKRHDLSYVLSFRSAVSIASDLDALLDSTPAPALPDSGRKSKSGTLTSRPTSSALRIEGAPTVTPRAEKLDAWIARATNWQAANLVSNKSAWFNDRTPRVAADPHLQCYNCGVAHGVYSYACDRARVSPSKVVVAAFRSQVSPSSHPAPSGPVALASGPALSSSSSSRSPPSALSEPSPRFEEVRDSTLR